MYHPGFTVDIDKRSMQHVVVQGHLWIYFFFHGLSLKNKHCVKTKCCRDYLIVKILYL